MRRQVQCIITEAAHAGTAAAFHRLPPLAGAAQSRHAGTAAQQRKTLPILDVIKEATPTSPSLSARMVPSVRCFDSFPSGFFFFWTSLFGLNKGWKIKKKYINNKFKKTIAYTTENLPIK